MGATYDYSTGKITRDFHFAKEGTACRLTALPARVGSSWCMRCEHYRGRIASYQFIGDDSFVKCMHKGMKDAEDCQSAVEYFNEKFELEALNALCY
jgi:nitrite reductase/ring-hydroxylating ferredoxin subunit